MKYLVKILPLLYLFIMLGCTDAKMDCENAMCTEMFASVQIKISDTTNKNLDGITTQTVLNTTGEKIHSQTEVDKLNQGFFTVVDDNNLKVIGFNKTQEVELKIFKNDKLIKSTMLSIKTDCCHVSKINGLEVISVN